MQASFISHIEFYIPKTNYSNSSIVYKAENINKIIDKTGINKKFAAKDKELATDLAIEAAKKIFRKNINIKDKIDYIIYCSQSPDFFLPSGSSIIQNKLFAKKDLPAIDINLGCSGFVYCYSIAQSLIVNDEAKNILILTSDTYSKYIDENDISVRTIFGDGASATIVSKIRNNLFSKNYRSDFGTDGSGYKDLIVPSSGLNKSIISQNGENFKKNCLHMNGKKIFLFALNTVPASIKKTIKKNKISLNSIDFFIFHQANNYMLESLRDKIGINKKKFYINLKNKGNTTSSSIPIALHEAIKKKLVKKNMLIMICGFGVGLSWGTTIIRINARLIKSIFS